MHRARVRIAHRLQIVLEPVVHRDERHLDELRLLVDDLLEIAHVDPIVARHHDAQIESRFLQLEEVHERAVEVQCVGDDVAVEARDAESVDEMFSPVLVFGT